MKVAVCAIAKKENLYIREWVEWYKNLGVSKIFIYDNNDVDGERFEEVINDYIESGFVEVIDVRGVETSSIQVNKYEQAYRSSIQHTCYIECYKERVSEFDWVLFCDVDEFIEFKFDYTLESFLNDDVFKDADVIMCPWITYDDNGLLHYEDRPVVERFTHLSKRQWYAFKSFVRTNKEVYDESIRHIIHTFRLVGDRVKYADGLKVNGLNDDHNFYVIPKSEVDTLLPHYKCVVNHYKTKTIEEYLERRYNRVWTQDGFLAYPKLEKIEDTIKEFFSYCDETDEKLQYIEEFKKKHNIES